MKMFWRIPLLGPLTFHIWSLDARRKADWIAPWLAHNASILEIGSGPGSVLKTLRERHYDVTAIDINDTSYAENLAPTLYDGNTLPYPDKSYDIALILTTLHHCQNPEAMLTEARRVANRVIVIEDIYTSPLHRRLTKIADSFTNLEFIGHPHNNKDDTGWQMCFKELNLSLTHTSQKPMMGYFLQALYVLECIPSAINKEIAA